MTSPRTYDPIARIIGALTIVTTVGGGGVAWGVNRASVETLTKAEAETRAIVVEHTKLPGHAEGLSRVAGVEHDLDRITSQLTRIEATVAATREDVAAMRGKSR